MQERRKGRPELSHVDDDLVMGGQCGLSHIGNRKALTREGSMLTSFLPPAIRVLIVRMIASPAADDRSSWIGISIDWIMQQTISRMDTWTCCRTHSALPNQTLERILLPPKSRQILPFLATQLVHHEVHTHAQPGIRVFVHLIMPYTSGQGRCDRA